MKSELKSVSIKNCAQLSAIPILGYVAKRDIGSFYEKRVLVTSEVTQHIFTHFAMDSLNMLMFIYLVYFAP